MYHIEKDLNNLIVLSAVVELHITHYSLYKDLDNQLGIFLWFLCQYHRELNSFYSIVNCSSRYRNILEKSLILWDAFLHCIKYARKMGFPWSAFFCIRTESNSALIWKNTSQKKTIFWHNLHSVNSNILNNKLPEPFFFNCDSLHARLNSHHKAWNHKKKKHNKITANRKSVQKEPTVKRYLLILDLKPLRSYVKGKNSKGRKFKSLAVWGKKLLR